MHLGMDNVPGYESLFECFGPRECEVLQDLSDHLPTFPEDVRRELSSTLQRAVVSLPALVQSIDASPLSYNYQHTRRPERSDRSLIDNLCRSDWQSAELSTPTSAVVGRALVIARINFLKALVYSLEALPDPEVCSLCLRMRELIDDAIFSKLAEELLTAAVSNTRNSRQLRRSAARHLVAMWTNFVRQPVVDFPTALLSAWRARRKVQTIYGTLFGVQELLSLVQEQCERDFVEFFTREQATADQMEAFREFLFALPYEELQHLQGYMKQHGLPVLSREQVHKLVKKTIPHTHSNGVMPSAEDIYASYRRRRLRAEYRSLTSRPGPKKTAEGYIMEFLLARKTALAAS